VDQDERLLVQDDRDVLETLLADPRAALSEIIGLDTPSSRLLTSRCRRRLDTGGIVPLGDAVK
jgi:hypothetical protein